MKKKLITGVCSILMMCTFALSVHAEEQTTDLNAAVDSTFTLTIPSSTQEITYNAVTTTISGKLSVTGNVKSGEYVKVTATKNALKDSVRNSEIPFSLYEKGTTTSFIEQSWSETDLRLTAPKSIELDVNIPAATWKNAKAGNYIGSIVFKAELF